MVEKNIKVGPIGVLGSAVALLGTLAMGGQHWNVDIFGGTHDLIPWLLGVCYITKQWLQGAKLNTNYQNGNGTPS